MGEHGKRATTRSPASTESGADGLSALLETERELTAELARADDEASAIVEAARAKVQVMAQEFEASLSAELRNLDANQETETAAAVSRTAAEARAHARRLDEVSEERVRELAALVLQDFLGLSPAPGAGA